MKKLALLLAALLLLSAAGCVWSGKEAVKPTDAPTGAPTQAPTDAPTQAPTDAPTPEPTEPAGPDIPDDISDYAMECITNADACMTQAVAFISKHPIDIEGETHPFVPPNMFETLSEDELAVYTAALGSASSFTEVELGELPERTVDAALKALYTDYPETETYFTLVQSVDGGWSSLFSMPDARYVEPAEDMDALKDEVYALDLTARYIASLIPEYFSPIDKYRALAYYICINTQYAHVVGEIPRYATTPFGAVINGYSICQGYALGFEYLCRAADLDCRRLTNGRTDDNMHYWDIVTLDQGTYYVDVTWSDSGSVTFRSNEFFEWFMFPADNHHPASDGTTTTGNALPKWEWFV